MSDQDTLEELVALLKKTARAHHEATGGINPDWAMWYAERLIEDGVNEPLDRDMTADELSSWLAEADRRYKREEPHMSWPRAYAKWLVEDV